MSGKPGEAEIIDLRHARTVAHGPAQRVTLASSLARAAAAVARGNAGDDRHGFVLVLTGTASPPLVVHAGVTAHEVAEAAWALNDLLTGATDEETERRWQRRRDQRAANAARRAAAANTVPCGWCHRPFATARGAAQHTARYCRCHPSSPRFVPGVHAHTFSRSWGCAHHPRRCAADAHLADDPRCTCEIHVKVPDHPPRTPPDVRHGPVPLRPVP